jgi:hypothetical protein
MTTASTKSLQNWHDKYLAQQADRAAQVEVEARKHPPHSFYLCGKIRHTDWRHQIVAFDLRSEPYPLYAYRSGQAPVVRHGVGPNLHYSGPYFIGCDHGCYHGPNAHGVGVNKHTCCCEQFDDGPELPMPFQEFAPEVSRNCLTSISRASIVFAWIEDLSAYGSFAEPGFAHSLGKPIWLTWPKPLPDLWFLQSMAVVTVIAETAQLAFRELLFSQLNRSLL